ncbi:MAG: ABC transporter substrate-binding protein, partial [Alphaproteobacteria bacterium]|nr:ABC transporter substrate-binding protein [Alphaproteobacteria bacterium]
EWSNRQFAFDAYTRSRSYFSNSEMAARGVPTGRELEILAPFRDRLPPELFTREYAPPTTDGSGNNRSNLREAIRILDEAGWVMGPDGVREKDGVRLSFEFVDSNPAFERWIAPFVQNLKRIGIDARFRVVDTAQLQNRLNNFDFDMTVQSFGQSNSPGNEQREYWGGEKADMPGSRNYIGVKDPVVDALVEMIVGAPTREELVLRCRALDRVLQWGYYLVPNWHIAAWRVAYWDKFGIPDTPPPYGLPVEETWWVKRHP